MNEKNEDEKINREMGENVVDTAIDECGRREEAVISDNRGIGVIELILILVVLIGLVLIFKDRIGAIVEQAFTAISGDVGELIS